MKCLKFGTFTSAKKVLLFHLCIILCVNCDLTVARKTDWLNNLVQNVLHGPKLYQVLMLYDQNGNDPNPHVADIITKFSKRFPTWKLTFQEATEKKAVALSLLPPFINSRTTNLVATIVASSETKNYTSAMIQTISFMVKLSVPKIRPKFLNIVLQEGMSSDYTKFLQHMWSMRFLDVSVLELVEAKPISRNKNCFLPSGKEQVMIHRLDPFKNISMTERYSPKSFWFPDKTLNVHGYQMKVGIFNYPASVVLKHNHSGHVLDAQGPDAMMMKTLAERMNFKIVWIPSKDEEWGSITCNNGSTTGQLYRLEHNEIHFTATQVGRFGTCDEHLYEHSRGTITFQLSVVVPVFREKSTLSMEWNITNAVALFGLVISSWFLSRSDHFERSDWQFLYLVQVVLGMGTPHEPKKIVERIVFGSILCACALHSSMIYTSIAEIATRNEVEVGLLNLSDVASSDLVPRIGTIMFNLLYNHTEGSSRILLDNAIQLPGIANKVCLELLSQNRKIACIVREEVARYLIQNGKDSCGRSTMKVLDERLSQTASGLFMEPASPYVNRFNNLIQRLTESGLYNLLIQNIHRRSAVLEDLDESCSSRRPESTLLRKQIIFILLIGYVFSLLSFVAEVIIPCFKKRGN